MAESGEKFLDPKASEALRHLGLQDYREEVIVPPREVKPWFTGTVAFIVLLFILKAGISRIKPLSAGIPEEIASIAIFAFLFYLRSFQKTISGRVVANTNGLRLEGRNGWTLSWSQIGGIRVQSRPSGTIIYTIDGSEKRLPFALSGPAQFDHNISNLRRMFESRGVQVAYSIVEPVPTPKQRFQLYQADLLRYLSVAFLIISIVLVAIYSQAHIHSPFTWIDAIPAGIGIAVGFGMYLVSQVIRNRIRAALCAVGEIQMGRANSLYRQITGRSEPAYGRYRYPDHISDRDSFNLGCHRPKEVLEATTRELFWTKEGLRLTPKGPVCRHSIVYDPNSDGRSTMSLTVIPSDWNPMEIKSKPSQRLGIWFLTKMVKLPDEANLNIDSVAQRMAARKALPQFDPRYLELVEE